MKKINIQAVMLLVCLVVFVISLPSAAQNGVRSGTVDLGNPDVGGAKSKPGSSGGSLYDSYMNNTPEITEVLTHESVGPATEAFVNHCQNEAQLIEAMRKKVAAAASTPGLSTAQRKAGQDLLNEAKNTAGGYTKAATWAEKAGKFLEIVDFVSSGAKVLGHLVEGDRTGAVTTILDEGAKKLTAAAGATGLAFIPGIGPTAGAGLGQALHEKYTSPALNRAADRVRTAEAKEKQLGPNIPGQVIMGQYGSRTLPPDRYMDKDGIIRQRTPEQQREYEKKFRDDAKKKGEWLNSDHPLARAEKDLRDGKISDKEFDKIIAAYNKDPKKFMEQDKLKQQEKQKADEKDKGKDDKDKKDKDKIETAKSGEDGESDESSTGSGKKRKKVSVLDDEDGEKGDKENDEEDSSVGQDEDGEEMGTEDEEEDESSDKAEEEDNKGEGSETPKSDILEKVNPIMVKAVTTFDEDYSSGGVRNIVTTTLTLSFYNVGALAPGYEKATMTLKARSSLGSEMNDTMSGTFSGGPNGTFRLSGGDGAVVLKMTGGKTISAPEGKAFTVQDPAAFANWPE